MTGRTVEQLRAEAAQETAIRALVKKYGGRFYGPRIEHVSIEERAFFRMMREFYAGTLEAAAKVASDSDGQPYARQIYQGVEIAVAIRALRNAPSPPPSYEWQGTGHDSGAIGHELQGRNAAPATDDAAADFTQRRCDRLTASSEN